MVRLLPVLSLGGLALAALLLGCSRSEAPAAVQAAARPVAVAAADPAPVTVENCGQPVAYPHTPRRVVSHDVNLTEMLLFLGLGERLVGYSGIPASKEIDPAYRTQLEQVPNLSTQGMNLEAMLGVSADFVFGGWSYGFRPGQVTPELLQRYGIASYVLTESCIRVGPRAGVALSDVLLDLHNLARIFRIEDQAAPRLQALEQQLQHLAQRLQGVDQRPRVFVYDSGQDLPTTSGRYGMPQAMIEAAGGRNIFDDLASNWPKGNWEDVVARDPQWIAIVDYGHPSAQGKIDFLLSKPELAQVEAIRKRQFVVMTYAEATPGPRTIARTQVLAAALHPERVPVQPQGR